MASREDNSNLYRVLERGDRHIDTSHPTAILLVGLTRAGKSTTFNWMLGKPLIGVGDEVEAHYENVVNHDQETAELGDTFTSVTLCPNVVELDKQARVELIDMAGYRDKRDYIGVLGVSYFLKAVFERVGRVKFLIVLSEDKLMENSGEGIISTFSGFIAMFNFQLLDEQLRRQIYDSVSVVITRSSNGHKHQGCLRRISRVLKDPKLIVDQKEELVRLIDDVINENRIEAFEVAVGNKNAPRCEMIQRFEGLGWKFFDIRQAESALGAELVALPFAKDFANLKEDQKARFDAVIEARVVSYVEFSRILNTLIRSIEEKWSDSVALWQQDREFSLDLAHFEKVFDHVRLFLEENDFYNSETLVVPQLKSEYKALNFVGTLNKVLEIYTITDQIGDQQEGFLKNMQAYTLLFDQLIECMQRFANSQQNEHLLLRLAFIVRRGFREFSKLYQLNPNAIHDVSQKMKDNCNLIFEETRKEFIERFVKQIDAPLLPRLFPRIEELLEYEQFFNDYENKHRRDYQEAGFFSEHHCGIEEAKATLYVLDDCHKQALRCYVRAFRYVCEMAYQAGRSFRDQLEIEAELNQLYMRKLATIASITSILRRLKDVPEANNYALFLATHVRNIHEACEVYESIIEASSSELAREKLDEYADFCLDWGRYEKANALLQRKLSL